MAPREFFDGFGVLFHLTLEEQHCFFELLQSIIGHRRGSRVGIGTVEGRIAGGADGLR